MIKIPKLLFCLMLKYKYYQVKVLAKRFNLNVHTSDSNTDSNFIYNFTLNQINSPW